MIREREEEASPLVCAVVEHALLVEQVQHAGGLALDELNALGGVGETHAQDSYNILKVAKSVRRHDDDQLAATVCDALTCVVRTAPQESQLADLEIQTARQPLTRELGEKEKTRCVWWGGVGDLSDQRPEWSSRGQNKRANQAQADTPG